MKSSSSNVFIPSTVLPPAQEPSVSPLDITTNIGLALSAAIRLSKITAARPSFTQLLSLSPPPWRK